MLTHTHAHTRTHTPPPFDRCPGAERRVVHNGARAPPCLAFLGDSHMMQFGWTIQELAREYDVSYLWLPR